MPAGMSGKVVMNEQKNRSYAFGQFRLDADKRFLFKGDEVVTLTPKALDTLLALVENRDTVMSKEELMRLVWAGDFVEENNLAQSIHTIRRTLGDGIDGAKYIETISKRGYRFVADVKVLNDTLPADFAESQPGVSHVGALAAGTVLSRPEEFPGSSPPLRSSRGRNTPSARAVVTSPIRWSATGRSIWFS